MRLHGIQPSGPSIPAQREESEGSMFSWSKYSGDLVLAGGEAQRVIALRLLKLSRGGPDAMIEANQMVSEKITALGEAAMTLVTGGTPQKVLNRYRTIMRANEARLHKGH